MESETDDVEDAEPVDVDGGGEQPREEVAECEQEVVHEGEVVAAGGGQSLGRHQLDSCK